MADSAIAVTGLTVSGGVRQNIVRITASLGSCLPYMALDKFEYWSATSNDRDLATKVGEAADVAFTHPGLLLGTTRYYWARARDLSGNVGDFFPASRTGGIAGTTISTGPSSVTNTDIAPGAVTYDKISVTSLEAISAVLGNVSINGTLVLNGTLFTPKFADNSVTILGGSDPGGQVRFSQTEQAIAAYGVTPKGGAVGVLVSANVGWFNTGASNYGPTRWRLRKNGVDTNGSRTITVDDSWTGMQTWIWIDQNAGSGFNTYQLSTQALIQGPTFEHYTDQAVVAIIGGFK